MATSADNYEPPYLWFWAELIFSDEADHKGRALKLPQCNL